MSARQYRNTVAELQFFVYFCVFFHFVTFQCVIQKNSYVLMCIRTYLHVYTTADQLNKWCRIAGQSNKKEWCSFSFTTIVKAIAHQSSARMKSNQRKKNKTKKQIKQKAKYCSNTVLYVKWLENIQNISTGQKKSNTIRDLRIKRFFVQSTRFWETTILFFIAVYSKC